MSKCGMCLDDIIAGEPPVRVNPNFVVCIDCALETTMALDEGQYPHLRPVSAVTALGESGYISTLGRLVEDDRLFDVTNRLVAAMNGLSEAAMTHNALVAEDGWSIQFDEVAAQFADAVAAGADVMLRMASIQTWVLRVLAINRAQLLAAAIIRHEARNEPDGGHAAIARLVSNHALETSLHEEVE